MNKFGHEKDGQKLGRQTESFLGSLRAMAKARFFFWTFGKFYLIQKVIVMDWQNYPLHYRYNYCFQKL